jgi:serine O-acetyltransferase
MTRTLTVLVQRRVASDRGGGRIARGRAVTVEAWWYRSCRCWRSGHGWTARAIKAALFVLCHAVLPYQAKVGRGVRLYHRGLGVVVHPRTTLGERVTLGHGVTIGVAGDGSGSVSIGDDVHVGAGATLLSRGGRVLRIGAGASIGAGTVVLDDLPPGARTVAPAPHVVEVDE